MSERRVTDREVHEILERATHLDQSKHDLTSAQLVEIGVEAGISRSAMEAAVGASQDNLVDHPKSERSPFWHLLRFGAIGGVAGGITGVGYLIESLPLAMSSFFIGIAFLVMQAVGEGEGRTHKFFQAGNAGYWGGYLVAVGTVFPMVLSWFGAVVPLIALILAVVGVVVVEAGWRIRQDNS